MRVSVWPSFPFNPGPNDTFIGYNERPERERMIEDRCPIDDIPTVDHPCWQHRQSWRVELLVNLLRLVWGSK